jgi:hypothetical protein
MIIYVDSYEALCLIGIVTAWGVQFIQHGHVRWPRSQHVSAETQAPALARVGHDERPAEQTGTLGAFSLFQKPQFLPSDGWKSVEKLPCCVFFQCSVSVRAVCCRASNERRLWHTPRTSEARVVYLLGLVMGKPLHSALRVESIVLSQRQFTLGFCLKPLLLQLRDGTSHIRDSLSSPAR